MSRQTAPASQRESPSATAPRYHVTRPPEDEEAELGKNIPGFAGYAFGGRENLIVYITDLKYAEQARADFEPMLRARKPPPPNPWGRDPAGAPPLGPPVIEIRRVNYTFDQLRDWRDAIEPKAFSIRGVVIMGLDVKRNQIMIGYDPAIDSTAGNSVERILDDKHVPREAVNIHHASVGYPRQAPPGAPSNIHIRAQLPRGVGMVHLDGGRFRMGTDSAEIPALLAKYPDVPVELFAQETPAHDVVLAPFDLDRAEVTVKSFAAFVDSNPRWKRSQLPGALNNGKYLSNWIGDEPAAADSALPVTFVTWYAATAYCEWRGARLPTEAEWEFAARAGHPGDVFPWGEGAPTPDVTNWSASHIGKPVPVARYAPNAFGLYDMAGNVWQYTADRWRDHYSDPNTGRVAAPADILAMKPAALALEASRHVIRGGSFDAGVINMRVRYRDSHPANGAGPHVGFRCAR